jgi:hypothetical protein
MAKINLFKKVSLYLSYRKNLLKNRDQFAGTYNLRIDRVNRIYTVVNIPEQVFEEPYNMRKSDIDKISEPYISEVIRQISGLLNKSGLSELYRLYDVQKVDKYSYLVIIGFSLFDTSKIARNFLTRILPISLVSITTLYLLVHFKLL